jgi:hypothetical protein
MDGLKDGIVRTFFLPANASGQDLTNMIAIVRQATGIQRAVLCRLQRAIILRGTADQMAKAGGLLHP